VLTESSGQFVIRDFPTERFSLIATKTGYSGGGLGQTSPSEPVTELILAPASGTVLSVVLRLWKDGSISGFVTDEVGEPAVGQEVLALRRSLSGGQTGFLTASRTKSDDRGRYRLAGLRPGQYLVAIPTSADGEGVASFYPTGSTLATAATLALSGGDALDGINLRVNEIKGFRISGALQGIPEARRDGTEVLIAQVETGVPAADINSRRSKVQQDGSFAFAGLTDGTYRIAAFNFPGTGRYSQERLPSRREVPSLPSEPTYWAETLVQVRGSDVPGVELSAQTGFRIRGRVIFEGTSPAPVSADLVMNTLVFMRVGGGAFAAPPPTRIEADHTFVSPELPPGKYSLLAPWPRLPQWSISSVVARSEEAAGKYFDLADDLSGVIVRFTDAAPGIRGTVVDSRGQPLTGYQVMVFPKDRNLWSVTGIPLSFRRTITADNGRFEVLKLMRGAFLVSVRRVDVSHDFWRDRSMLEELARGAAEIPLGQTGVVDISLVYQNGR
jgi:hypothetical protein